MNETFNNFCDINNFTPAGYQVVKDKYQKKMDKRFEKRFSDTWNQ